MINNFKNPNEFSLILTGVVCGIGFVIILIYLVLQCVCCEKSPNTSPSNGINNGTRRKPLAQGSRFHNLRSMPNPDIYDAQYANHVRFPADPVLGGGHRNLVKNSKQPRILVQNGPAVASVPHRALPAPPSSTGPPYSESLTRESSTSELYASVDKNPQTEPVCNPNMAIASLGSNQQKQNVPSSSATVASHCQAHLYAKICDDHHVYSKIWSSAAPGPNGDTYDNVNAADDSDFDPFYSRVNENSNPRATFVPVQQRLMKQLHHHAYEYPVFTSKQMVPVTKEPLTVDPLYSKIGSEDPYSSIKSEEHYSRVEHEDSLSMETDGPSTSRIAGCKIDVDDDVYFRYSRPGPSTKRAVFRRYSDGDEYAMVRKGSAGLYSTPARRIPPPTIPEKQLSRDEEESEDQLTVVEAKKEPSYRYITVRESLDALRERMEQQQRPLVTNYVAVSDPSLHYYSTISEHSYEVVPSRIMNGQNTPAHPIYDDTLYIDQDDLLDVRADISVGPDLNSTSHSDELTIKGSHVTLVQVEAVLNCNKSNVPDDVEHPRPSSVPPPPHSSTPSTSFHNLKPDYDNVALHNRSVLNNSFVAYGPSASCESKHPHHQQSSTIQKPSSLFHGDDRKLKETAYFESKIYSNNGACKSKRTCRNAGTCESQRRSDVDPEYPTTFCFCHSSPAPKKFTTDAMNGNKRPDDKRKRDRHF